MTYLHIEIDISYCIFVDIQATTRALKIHHNRYLIYTYLL